jgi:hypothetical protein
MSHPTNEPEEEDSNYLTRKVRASETIDSDASDTLLGARDEKKRKVGNGGQHFAADQPLNSRKSTSSFKMSLLRRPLAGGYAFQGRRMKGLAIGG